LDAVCNDKIYSITLVPIAEGGYVNLYGSDITARKRAEEHVQKLNQELSHHATELEFANEELGIVGEKLQIANEDLQKEIAEHKRAEEALRISEEKYRLIADHASDWIYWIKPDMSFQYISPSCEQLTGFTPLEFVNNPQLFLEIIHPEDRDRMEAHLGAVREGSETHNLDYRILTRTNETRWISHSCDPVYAPDGRYLGRNGTNRDITERKRVEEALRQSEERFRFALANSPIIVANLDRQLRYTWVYNPLVGYHAEDLVGKQIGLSADPETKAKILRLLEELLTNGVSVQWETTIQTADGAKFFQSQAEPLRAAQGQISGVALVSIDITERKQAEDALRADEERYRAIFDNALDAIVVTDPAGGGAVLSANPAACRLFGYSAKEFHGLSREAMIESTSPNLTVLLEQRQHSGKAATEMIYKRKDGVQFSGEISSTFYQDKNGERRSVAIIRDITERKEAEEKIRRSEATLRAILDQMPSGVTVRDAQAGVLILSNSRSREIMGGLVDSADQFAQYRGFHPDGSPYQTEDWPLSRSMATGEVIHAEEVAYERSGGDRITLSINSAPVRDPQGQIVMAVSVFDNITERKHAEEELHRLLEELKYSNAELEQFAYVASHDLQEPLRMVSSYMQLLARRYQGKLDSDADEFIAFAVDGAKRMQNLINDLLAYSRVGTRGRTLVSSSCEGALKEALANLQFAIEESGATITHEPLPEVKGDPTQLVQLFQNLLSNAIKFRGPEPPRIHVDVHQESAEWVFRVCDNGIGLDSKFAERIFVIFQRLHHRDSYPGTGIGLAICKRIIQRHSGRIWVESMPGEGATFYFTLPIKENT
jgi:PAS domain S-box-containing protein